MAPNDNSIYIVADDRERKSGVIESLEDLAEVTVQITRLSLGDYVADNRLLFERKSLKDFAVSIIDGRFFKQMIRVADSALKGILILEGTSRDMAETGVQREAMQGALITASLILGIPVLRSKGPLETAQLIVYAARQIKRVTSGGIYRRGYRPKGKRKRQAYILQGLPGIGHDRAVRLLDHFGSVEGVMAASIEELKSVDGIGRKTADRIKWAISEQTASYGIEDEFPM